MNENESLYCHRCRDVLVSGDEYYNFDGLILCQDCGEAFFNHCRHTVGETVEKI